MEKNFDDTFGSHFIKYKNKKKIRNVFILYKVYF
jgi:hypothetical protein